MADKKIKAPEEGPCGVDRWSCNGYGLTVNGKKVEPPKEEDNADEAQIDEIKEV